jgi:CheY-like chemotaxis protein
MTAGPGFVPVVDDHFGESPGCCPEPRARQASRADRGEQAAGTQGTLRDELVDCVPVNVPMPELDGYQVLGHIRSDPSRSGSLVDKLTARRALPSRRVDEHP